MPPGTLTVRQEIEAREFQSLSEFAAKAAESKGRAEPEPQDRVRTDFQRDRDRILHSKPFRRLKHKTQVFIDPRGDHYRTRLTHTLEVAQIARTVGRALRLNEDLIEAIALGHDVGHTPFGHAGEAALDAAIRELDHPEFEGFSHDAQSLRIVEVITPLNLTAETLAGIAGHSKGRRNLTPADGVPTSTLEASVVRISDRIAYMNHDLDDALRAGILSEVPKEFAELGPSHAKRVGAMVEDVIHRSQGRPQIEMSEGLLGRLNQLKELLFERVYTEYPRRFPDIGKAQRLVRELFLHFVERPEALPEGFEGIQGAIDYVSGMTDRFALDAFVSLRLPDSWQL
jgi:dGTPase